MLDKKKVYFIEIMKTALHSKTVMINNNLLGAIYFISTLDFGKIITILLYHNVFVFRMKSIL